jgi:hypothetical protein
MWIGAYRKRDLLWMLVKPALPMAGWALLWLAVGLALGFAFAR